MTPQEINKKCDEAALKVTPTAEERLKLKKEAMRLYCEEAIKGLPLKWTEKAIDEIIEKEQPMETERVKKLIDFCLDKGILLGLESGRKEVIEEVADKFSSWDWRNYHGKAKANIRQWLKTQLSKTDTQPQDGGK